MALTGPQLRVRPLLAAQHPSETESEQAMQAQTRALVPTTTQFLLTQSPRETRAHLGRAATVP